MLHKECSVLKIKTIFFVVLDSDTFVYIEGSSPQQTGNNASLISGILPAQKDYCLSFFYNMYGVDMGTIQIDIEVRAYTSIVYVFW